MEFTREQLEQVVVSGRITVHEPYGFCSFVPDIRNLASLAIAQLDKIEALELDAEDAREDIDSLDQHVVKLRAQLATAEAERDILQWASEHSGGKDECEKCGREGMFKSFERAADDRYKESIAELREMGERIISEDNGDDCSCDCGIVRIPESPERPHEALVWALFYSDGISVNEADSMLKAWRAHWPEPKA